jgi:hypothetical protein
MEGALVSFLSIVWPAARRKRLERERARDDYALDTGAITGDYAEQILVLASGGNSRGLLATTSIAHPSQLEMRLRTILNPGTRRGRISRRTAAALLSSLAAVLFSVAAIHLGTLLSLSLPTSFAALAAPPATPPIPAPTQQPTLATAVTGSVSGRVVWTDGTSSSGATVSAIATTRTGLPDSWIMGTTVAGTAITDSSGQFRIENLPPGLYHIVTGPVYLPRTFSDVAMSSSARLANVSAGKSAGDMNFTCVRNAQASYDSSLPLTITGKLVLARFGGPPVPSVLTNNSDGSSTYWQFWGTNQNARFWWPGLDAAKGGVIEKMVNDGEFVTITGKDSGYTSRSSMHVLYVSEVTRGGVPAR